MISTGDELIEPGNAIQDWQIRRSNSYALSSVLKKAGLTAKIFEGADRTGGRMFTRANLLGDGFTTELGGEFIDQLLVAGFGHRRFDVSMTIL